MTNTRYIACGGVVVGDVNGEDGDDEDQVCCLWC